MTSCLKYDCSNPLGQSILIKFYQIVGKNYKQEVTKFGSPSLSGFRLAANTLVEWDKNRPLPPLIDNRVENNSFTTITTDISHL